MMEKQMIPSLRFPEFDDLLKRVELKKVATINPKSDELPNSFIYIDLESVNKGFLSKEERIYKPDAPSRAQRLLKQGDILYQTVRPYQKNNYFFDKSEKDYVASTGYAQIRTNNISSYLYQYLHTDYFVNRVLVRCTGTSYPAINSTDLSKININIPSLPEQQKIASFLTAVDDKITQLTKKKALLEQYKKGVMQKVFNQELRFKDDKGNVFPEWEEKKLGDFKHLSHGDGNWILSKDISTNGDYEIIQLGNIGFGLYVEKKLKTISSDKFKELKGTLINKGDLLINRMVDGALNSCILNKDGNYITSVDVCWIRENEYFNNYFLMSLLLFSKNQNKLLNLSSGSGRVRISKKNLFNEFSFMLPSAKEQTKIANFLSDIDIKIEGLATQIEKSNAFKKGLLQKMFV